MNPSVAALKGCATGALLVALMSVAQAFRPALAPSVAQAFRPALTPSVALAQTARPSFADFLAGVRQEAVSRGIRQEVVDEALSNIDEPLPVVLERDRAQAEIVLPLEKYVARRLTPKFLANAREAYASNRALLEEVGSAYAVSPRIIAAVWGLETNFGRFSGIRPTVAALATLAWDPRRATFFRNELFDALEILNRGDIDFAHLRGSWAGAMGQVQFMPSSYLKYAEDYDGDGRRDIWSTPSDVFASIANYLAGHGWSDGEQWGREVRIPADAAHRVVAEVARREGSCHATRDMTVALPVARWQQLGVTLPNGRKLPNTLPDGALVSGATQHYLVFSNYDALLDYNCAHSYAVSVGLLSDRLAGPAAARTKKLPRRVAR